jgi:hypothetical protein
MKKGPAAMIAPFPATSSHASRSAVEPAAKESSSRAVDWGARLVQIGLALYLLPVLILIFMIGGLGMALVGVAVLAARMARWRRSGEGEPKEDLFRS